jgi:hypothetical protein
MFKKRRGIHITYNKQGLIYFVCVNLASLPVDLQKRVVKKIAHLCSTICEDDNEYAALYEVLTNDRKSVFAIAAENYISEKRLYRLRKMFYENW